MRRACLLIFTLLVAGAIVNIVIAWACAAWTPQDRWASERVIDVPANWPEYLVALGWPAPVSASVREGVGFGATRTGGMRRLPLTPLWPGLFINTLFYMLLLGLLFVAPGNLRRRLRRRGRQCQACGYPIGASLVCTECGAAIESRAQRDT